MATEVTSTGYTNEEGIPLFPSAEDEGNGYNDHSWVRTAFVLPDKPTVERMDVDNRFWTSARSKFTDGKFGCNIGINCHPQFTQYADYPETGTLGSHVEPTLNESSGNYGLGGFWSSMFDDTEQVIYMRFGVPEFNSLFNFFKGAYDYSASSLARTGRLPSFLYTGSKLLGTYFAVRALPLVGVIMAVGATADYFYGRQSAKYYRMRPTMHLYWSAVNNLVNTLAINSGIYPRIMNMNNDETQRLGQPLTIDQGSMDIYSALAPDIFTSENYIDVFALANRAQRMANEMIHNEFEEANNGTTTDWAGYLKKTMVGSESHSTRVVDKNGEQGILKLIEKYLEFGDFYSDTQGKLTAEEIAQTPPEGSTYQPLYSQSSWNNFKKMLTAEFRQGGSFACFRVTNTGSKSESFSNNTQASGLENKLNSINSNFQEQRFNMGSISAMGGEILETAGNLATDAIMGVLDGVTFGMASSIKGLLGEGYVEIPEHWQSSSSSLPTAQYKIKLEAWNANVLTRIMKLYVPFAMIAAGAWPRSVGRQAYTSPFLCQLYDQGNVQVPLGMITEFTVTRGGGNVGFTPGRVPLSMEISFTVKDLSRVLHMPLVAGKLFETPTMIDEDSSIVNYLATVAGMSHYQQIYPSSKVKIRAAKLAMKIGLASSPAFWASFTHDGLTNTVAKYAIVGPLIEALSRNPEVSFGSKI